MMEMPTWFLRQKCRYDPPGLLLNGILMIFQYKVNPVTQNRARMRSKSPNTMGSYQVTSPYNMGIQAADKPLIMPLILTLKQLRLDAIIFLSYSSTLGLTINFKNDPLTGVLVESSFDDVASIRQMLSQEIENRLRVTLRDVLPKVLHEMSLDWTRSSANASFTGGFSSTGSSPIKKIVSAPPSTYFGNMSPHTVSNPSLNSKLPSLAGSVGSKTDLSHLQPEMDQLRSESPPHGTVHLSSELFRQHRHPEQTHALHSSPTPTNFAPRYRRTSESSPGFSSIIRGPTATGSKKKAGGWDDFFAESPRLERQRSLKSKDSGKVGVNLHDSSGKLLNEEGSGNGKTENSRPQIKIPATKRIPAFDALSLDRYNSKPGISLETHSLSDSREKLHRRRGNLRQPNGRIVLRAEADEKSELYDDPDFKKN